MASKPSQHEAPRGPGGITTLAGVKSNETAIGGASGTGVDGDSQPIGPAACLYVVSTPIGNLGDMTYRAVSVLRSVSLVVAEDTRHTGVLLKHFEIKAPMVSYHAHNRVARLPRILDALGRGDVALVTDAGTPVISDPGQELVAAAWVAGARVEALPGASAPMAALAVCGMPFSSAHFVGFFPRRGTERRRFLSDVMEWPGAIVGFEAPHRLEACLADMMVVFGNREVAVCNDLTKKFERVFRGTITDAIADAQSHPPRGEYTLVVAGHVEGAGNPGPFSEPDSVTRIDALRKRFDELASGEGGTRGALRTLVAESGLSRKLLYREFITRA